MNRAARMLGPLVRLALLVALAIGCSSSSESGQTGTPDVRTDGGATPIAAEDFCHRFIEAFSDFMGRCGCSAEAAAGYRAERQPICEEGGFFGNLTGAVRSGDLIYDAQAAEALFARLERPETPCVEEMFRALRLDSEELYSFAGVFTGTHALGSPCTLPVGFKGGVSDCREGLCAPDGQGGGACIALAREGEPCDVSGDHNLTSTAGRLCFDRRPPDNDGEYESAFDSLSCTPAGPASTMRVCRRDLDDGEPCGSSGACLSGICEVGDVPREGICVPKRRNGEACEAHVQCESGACQNGEPRTCGPKLAEGAPCDYSDAACASGTCHSGDGNGGVCGPAPGRMLGESCSNSFECISTGHGGSRDGTCHEGRCVADVCVPFLP
jgi:hypothetical protein